MEFFIRRLGIESLRAKVDASRRRSAVIGGQILAASTDAEKDRLARRFDRELKRTHAMQHRLEVLERQKREAAAASAQRATTDVNC